MSAPSRSDDTEYPDEYHHIPFDDMREHELCGSCWCQPEFERHQRDVHLLFVWLHHAADGRHHYQQRLIPLQ
jgi:hypothetical protein